MTVLVDRHDVGHAIANRLGALQEPLTAEFAVPGRIASFVVDDLLPEELA